MIESISTQRSVTPRELSERIDRLLNVEGPRYRRLWSYYRNPMLPRAVVAGQVDDASDKPYRQAQEWGLPPRITGVTSSSSELVGGSEPLDEVARKEIVIENDIAWRIDTLVDWLFGKPIVISATSSDPARRERIESLVRAVIAHNGGAVLLQQLALLGAVYGFVDVLVKLVEPERDQCEPSADGAGPSAGTGHTLRSHPPEAEPAPEAPPDADPGASTGSHDASIERIARMVRLEIVEPARALPLLCPTDYRVVEAYAQVYLVERSGDSNRAVLRTAAKRGWFDRFLDRFGATRRGTLLDGRDEHTLVTDILTPTTWKRYEDEKLVAEGVNSLGIIPLVHIQNTALPFEYAGAGDLEPLLPLQDELNTRLCDRAHRITMQSFRMYLGKGIDNFNELPVAPGRMWTADDPGAEVIEFGGDAACPSEDRHITELREAMDKVSSVTPIAAGAIKGRIGRLTSGAALRVTLMALLAKTERKRTSYGEGIARMCELSLAWLDRAGVFPTSADERRVEIHWPNPLPVNEMERLEEAKLKREVGVPPERVLQELGY